MAKKIEIAGWKKSSCDDGPGIRSVLFLQGCSMNCPGCHNKMAQKPGEGVMMDVSDVAEYLVKNCHNRRITFSGGEPLEQWDNLKELLLIIKQKDFEACLYTGWSKEQIPDDVFEVFDYVKCGNFVSSLASEKIHYVGSSNQKMYRKDYEGVWKEIDLTISA